MRQRTIILASLALAGTGFGATSAAAQDEYRHGHIRQVEAGVTLQRATEASAEEAIPNLPFLPGDRVWTDAGGRVEFQFPEGTAVRLDRGSKLDYSDHDESRDERVVLRLWSGGLILRARAPESAIFEIETPGGLVEAMGPSVVRIDVEGGQTQLSVYDGEATLDTGRERVRLAEGERTWARWGDGPAEPAPFDRYAQDDFGLWDGDLESREAWAANSRRYLPHELEPYAPQFDAHGTWAYEEPVGYVWQPRVTVGWTPYSNGRWIWTSYGWNWVPYEPWGWAPHHYGRWGFSASLGWYWSPGTVWSGGWVSWGIGNGYVGWCALGRHNRPVYPWRHDRGWSGHSRPRGHAVPRGSIGHERAWSVVRSGDLGRGGAHRRVDPGSVGALRVADSISERPDRSARAFTRAVAVPRAAQARPRPGTASRAARGASPVPMGSTAGASVRSRAGTSAGAPAAGRSGSATGTRSGGALARPRAGSPAERGAAPSTRRGDPSWVGSSRSPRSGSVARPAPSTRTPDSRSPSSTSRSSGVSGRPRTSTPRSSGVSSRPSTSIPRSSGVSSRPSTSTPRSSGVSSRPRTSTPRSSGVSSRSNTSAPRSSGVSSRPRTSAPRSSGVSSRPRTSAPRSSGVSSRPRTSAPRSSGVSSRPRTSTPRSSGVSSRPRTSAPRSSGTTSRSPSTGSRSSGAASRSRGSGGSRGSTPRSGSRSGARSRGGSQKH